MLLQIKEVSYSLLSVIRSPDIMALRFILVATAALKSKKAKELELERLQGTRFQLEMQINTLESASFNAETMSAMKKASSALKDIHGKLCVCSRANITFLQACLYFRLIVLLIRWIRRWRIFRNKPNWRTKCLKRYQPRHMLEWRSTMCALIFVSSSIV